MMVGGFALGVSSGPACLASCTAALGPWLVSERDSGRRPCRLLAQFLAGRLLAYVAFAVAAWAGGRAVAVDPALRAGLFAVANLGLGIALIPYGLRRPPRTPTTPCGRPGARRLSRMPLLLGMLLGLNLCPPFLLATTLAAQTTTLAEALAFFLVFFLGTSLWLVPVPLLGALGRIPALPAIARFAAALVGLHHAHLGVLALGSLAFHG